MVATKTATPEIISLEGVRELLRGPGPCITMSLPPYRPGEPAGSPANVLKSNIGEARRRLAEEGLPESKTANLLQPLEQLVGDPKFDAGADWGRAIFRSPSVFEQFHLTQPVKPALNVGGSFAIRQIAPELAQPRLFYILALSKKRVTLLRCVGLHAEAIKLPHGIPETLEEALALEPPDHDLENRSAIGSSTGAMHGVRFGTGSGRETQHAHLADYYKIVDRGMQEFLHGDEAPLILAGVGEDTAIYQNNSGYRSLAKSPIVGSLDASSPQEETIRHAYAILRAESQGRQAAALIAARERITQARFSTDTDTILHAAFEGRVGQLFLNETAESVGVFERGAYQSWGKEDLLNLAAVQTLLHHGWICELPSGTIPDGSAAAALFRF